MSLENNSLFSSLSKMGDYVVEKKDALVKTLKTESDELFGKNTKNTLGKDSLNYSPIVTDKNLSNAVSFDPVNNLPENLRALYKDVSASLPPTEKSALDGLLKSNKLTMKDSTGKTIMENLSEIKNGKKETGIRSNELLKDAVLILSDRKYITQGPHGTCGAGSIENHLAVKDPAELVRIVKDLAKSGESFLRDGSKLKSGTGSLKWHENNKTTDGSREDRRDFNIIFQSSVMRNVALVGGDRTFGSKIHIPNFVDYNVDKDNGDANSVKTGDSAANPELVASLLHSITGKKHDNVLTPDGNMKDIEKSANSGKQPLVVFSVDDYFSLHYVVVEKVEKGNIYFQNTAKSKDNGKVDVMPIEEFKNKVRGVILSK
ncbi:MAG: hypothetical protein AABZ74_11235 [Cyanobacteriota bacterium]